MEPLCVGEVFHPIFTILQQALFERFDKRAVLALYHTLRLGTVWDTSALLDANFLAEFDQVLGGEFATIIRGQLSGRTEGAYQVFK